MEKRAIKVVNCDLFCINDFALNDDIVITGNFYAKSNVLVASLETGEDIIINAPKLVCADTILSFGSISMCAPVIDSVYVYSESECSIFAYPRDPYTILKIEITDNLEDKIEINGIENFEEDDFICPHCLLEGNCDNCPCTLDLCNGDCEHCKFKKFVCDCHNDCETCEYREDLEDFGLFDGDDSD